MVNSPKKKVGFNLYREVVKLRMQTTRGMLKTLKNNEFSYRYDKPDFNDEVGLNGYVLYVTPKEVGFLKFILYSKLASGFKLVQTPEENMWQVIFDVTHLTLEGHTYLFETSFFQRHPFIEKLSIALITFIITVLTQLFLIQ